MRTIEISNFGTYEHHMKEVLQSFCGVSDEGLYDVVTNLRRGIPQRFNLDETKAESLIPFLQRMCPDVKFTVLKIVEVKITKWGDNKLHCIKAVKDLMDLTLRGAKEMVENSKMPCVLRVYDDEKLKTFKDYTQAFCSGINYTVEDVDNYVDTPDIEVSEYSDETLLAIAKIEEGQNCIGEAKQMLLSQIRFLNTSLKGVVRRKEELEVKVEDLTRQNETLIAHLKRARESKKVLENKLRDSQAANRELNEFVEKQTEFIKAVENISQQLNKLNSKSIKDGSTN